MVKAPTYADLDKNREEKMKQAEYANAMVNTQNSVANEVEATKNPMLQEYMSRNAGLGSITKAPSADAKVYSESAVQAVIAGQADPRAVMADNSVLPEYKGMLQEMLTKQQAPQGLGQLG